MFGRFARGLSLICGLLAALGQAPRLRAQPAGPVFTAEERDWIAAHPVIRVGHDAAYPPYAFLDAQGQLVGLDPALLELLGQITGLRFVHETRPSLHALLEDLRAGKIDLLMSLGSEAVRDHHLVGTEAYSHSPGGLLVEEARNYLDTPEGLHGRRVAWARDYAGRQPGVTTALPQAQPVEYPRTADALRALARGEVDAVISDLATATHLIRVLHLDGVRLGGVQGEAGGSHLVVRPALAPLAGILNKALLTLPPEERRALLHRWLPVGHATGRGWILAFKLAAGLGIGALLVFFMVMLHTRQLEKELAVRRQIQEELEITRDRLAQASQEKSHLVGMVAHDLRSPLTGIMLGAEFIETLPEPLPPPVTASVASIKEAAQLMARLIGDLLAAQKLEAGRLALTLQRADAVEILRTAARTQAAAAARKGIRIEYRLPASAPLDTAAGALQQIVDNLLSNALKYSLPGTRVLLSVDLADAHCRLSVRDQGPGVKREERELIFAQFGRGSARPTAGESSSGLGLWIVRRLATNLGGRVWCEDAPGGGSCFVLELPRTAAAAPLPEPAAVA